MLDPEHNLELIRRGWVNLTLTLTVNVNVNKSASDTLDNGSSQQLFIYLQNYCPNLPHFYSKLIINWVNIKCKDVTTKEQIKNESLWLNNLITSNGKSLYSPRLIRNKLLYINDICKRDGSYKDISQLNTEFNVNINFLEYLRIRQCIPYPWKQILNNAKVEDKTTDIHFNKMKRYNTLKCKTIYWLSLPNKHDISSLPNSHKYWMDKYKLDNISNYLTAAFTCIRITSIQALKYKIIIQNIKL